MKKMMVATLMALLAGGASAQVYIEGSFGSTNLDADCAGTTSCDKSGTGAKLVVGYSVNPNVAVEAGYVNFGEAKASVYAADARFKSNAFYIGGAGRGQFTTNFWGVARLGLAQVETKIDRNFGGSNSKSKANALFGLGVEYNLNPKFKITGGVDFTQSPIADNNETATLRLLSIGAQYNF